MRAWAVLPPELQDDQHRRWYVPSHFKMIRHVRPKKLSKKSDLAGASHYALARWKALTRYRDDGRVEIDNNAVERASLRAVALRRKNHLFAGADCGGERGAAIYCPGALARGSRPFG